ncbi:MAG: hypothetical protein ACKVOW_08560, partial [Chitinophagaceae bacterium]
IAFKKGTFLSAKELMGVIEKARLDIINTQLFLEVLPQLIIKENGLVDVEFVLKERWYFFPLPYFKMIDRNPNQWIVEQNASLERVNYGLKFNWENISGRRDKLGFRYVNGYSKQYSVSYEQPFADKKLQTGFLIGVFYTGTRQTSYATDSNKQVFFPVSNNQINDLVRKTFRIESGVTFRKGSQHRHTLRLHYVTERLNDTITRLISANAGKGYLPYFTDNKASVRFGEFVYTYQYYDLDNISYPLKGFAFNGSFFQRGLGAKGMNLWQLSGKAGRYIPLGKTTYASLYGLGTVKLPFKQPAYNMPIMGYGDFFMQGLEYYVVDGVMGGMLRTTVAQELFKINVPTFIIKNEKYKKIPFRVLAKVYGNIGGVYNPYFVTGVLNNTLLYTYGAGLDILSYYDFTARIDYSFNHLGEKGLFLHVRKDF